MKPASLREFDSYMDDDFRRTIWSALRTMAVVLAVSLPLVWWKLGWRSAALLLVGGLISGSGLLEWLRLLTALMSRMDAGGEPRPMGRVLALFFLRVVLAVAVLYGSLKSLDGSGSSIYALAGGLALGVFALSIEGLRLIKSWT